MEIKPTSDDELNIVLTYLNHGQKIPGEFNHIMKGLNWQGDENMIRLGQILRKLKRDGFVETDPLSQGGVPMQGKNDVTYLITYDGIAFIENGSYKQKRINDKIISDDLKGRNRRMERNEVLLWIATFALVLVEILTHRRDLIRLFCGCY
jgi:DNA-binding PadR family transcriptional regulator